MCGIVGYLGGPRAMPVIMEGLARLAYRGYDSSGIALVEDGGLHVERAPGKLEALTARLAGHTTGACLGIGHTRWATHGRPNEDNAHPHRSGPFVVVHNGIVENFVELRRRLEGEGYVFASETDTEVIVHLIHSRYRGDFPRAVREALRELRGSYAVAVVSADHPDTLIAAREQSPMVVGLGEGEFFVASDIPAFLKETRKVIILENGQMALVTPGGVRVLDLSGEEAGPEIVTVTWDALTAEKGGYKHFMLKEIFEQADTVLDTFRGRIDPEKPAVYLDGFPLSDGEVREISRIAVVACGTSYHAGLVAEYVIEALARLPVEVDVASEFRYRGPVLGPDTLVVVVSQSGETADTLAALREARSAGSRTVAVCNVLGSSLAREADGVIYTHAGPEIGVASTKAFTAQLAALYLMALHLGRVTGHLSEPDLAARLHDLLSLPGLIKQVLELEPRLEEIARGFYKKENFLFLGRGISYPVALEGALKLKEISYIHAEGYAGGEMKHGPIALIDERMPVVALAPPDATREKMLSNIREVAARDGLVIGFGGVGDEELAGLCRETVSLPATHAFLNPILQVIPLQLLAYHVADRRGTDVDQPRNLAKSVTVE